MSFLPGMMPSFNRTSVAAAPTWAATDTEINESVGFASTCTFTAQAIGTATATRVVVVGAGLYTGGTPRVITGITVGGTSLTEAVSTGSGANTCGLWYGVITTGTTASIVVTASGAMQNCQIAVGWLDNVTTAPTTTASKYAPSNQNSPYDTTSAITVPSGGFGVAFAWYATGSASSWGNMTEDLEQNGTNNSVNISSKSASGSISPSLTAGNFITCSVVAATWGA